MRKIYHPGRAMLLAAAAALLCSGPAAAQTTGTQPGASQPGGVVPASPAEQPQGFWERPTMLGDAGGLRTALAGHGVTVNLLESDEVQANLSGALKRGAAYDGLTTLTVQVDSAKAFGYDGGLFNISGLQIHGRNFSQYYLGVLQNASGINTTPTTALWEAWYQQSFAEGSVDVRAGLQGIDQEFLISQNAALFVNAMTGWPVVPSYGLYASGPSYPLSSLGVRLRAKAGPFTALAGVFQDNPPGGPFANDGPTRGSSRFGGNFNLRTGALAIAELQFAVNPGVARDTDIQPNGQAGSPQKDGAGDGGSSDISSLPGVYKLGAYYDSASFPDQRYDYRGVSLASPASNRQARLRRNNLALYAVADQMVWRKDAQSISLFGAVMGAPGDRNAVDFGLYAGATWKGALPGRDDDTIGAVYGLATLSSGARGLDRDAGLFTQPGYPVRSREHLIEVFYQVQITPWLQVQPDVQYIARPSGGVPDPNRAGRVLGDAVVVGVRTNITF